MKIHFFMFKSKGNSTLPLDLCFLLIMYEEKAWKGSDPNPHTYLRKMEAVNRNTQRKCNNSS